MDALVVIIVLLVAAACGAAATLYRFRLKAVARFLRERDRLSNLRLPAGGALPGTLELVKAINQELDASADQQREQQQAEAEFQQNLTSLSHDIRTPLAGAKGYLQLAESEEDAALRTGYLQAAAARLEAMQELLDQLLSYGRSVDQPEQALEQMDVLLPLASVLAARHPGFQKREMSVQVKLGEEPLLTQVNPEALRRIYENVIQNALIHGEGALLVQRTGKSIMFVNPLRPGEEPDPVRVFERFYREDAARGRTGTGLGLAVVHNLCEAQGISASATVQEGAFALELVFDR